MQDAFNLGWKLALVLRGHADDSLLDTYEAERRPVAEQVIWAASSLHEIFMRHGKDVAERTQTMFEPGYTEKVVNYCSGVAYTYRDVAQKPSGLTDIDGPAIGDRAPDVDFESGGTLFDRMRRPWFTLLAMPGSQGVPLELADLETRTQGLVKTEVLPRSEALSKRYGPPDGRLFLIRPDGYVGFKVRTEETHLLEAHLGKTLKGASRRS